MNLGYYRYDSLKVIRMKNSTNAMKLSVVFFLSLVAAVAIAQKKGRVCNGNNIKRQKCIPGKGCIARVPGLAYSLDDITSRSFIVRWNPVGAAKCYFVEILKDDTNLPQKIISCFKGTTYKATGLRPWQVYGVRVSAVNRRCKRGQPSATVLRIKTKWDETFKLAPKQRKSKPTPKPGKCGRGRFTCHSGARKCIPSKLWCDRSWQCADGSDERFCPGGCTELKVKFNNGNYSCSRFGSPDSYCFFDCDDGYMRDGARFTKCVTGARKWSHDVPVCRLPFTRVFKVVHEETTETSVTVEWEPVEGATKYAFQAVETLHVDDEADEFMVSKVVDASVCCRTVITGLKPRVEYRISMWAFDADELHGMESLPIFFVAVTPPKAILKG